MTGNGGLPSGGQCGAKYQDALVLRSFNEGATWASTPVPGATAPLMMTSVPGRLFMFTCAGGAPMLWWSDDNGISMSPGIRLSWSKHCVANSWSPDGSEGIGRRQWTSGSGPGTSVLRATFPSRLADGRSAVHLFNVNVTSAGLVTSTFVRTIAATNADVVQATLIEPDPSLSGITNSDNATLIYWKELSRPGVSPQSARARGLVVKNNATFSPVFNISTTTATGTTTRSWPSTAQTGHYAKGAFYFNSASNQLRYFVPWIEQNGSTRQIHTKIYGVPK